MRGRRARRRRRRRHQRTTRRRTGSSARARHGIAGGLHRPRRASTSIARVQRRDPRRCCATHGVDLVVMAGYMRLLGKEVLDVFPNRVLNLHPALLPSFPGADGIKDAFDYGVKVTGVTVHFANEDFDEGPIIAQEPVIIAEDDTHRDARGQDPRGRAPHLPQGAAACRDRPHRDRRPQGADLARVTARVPMGSGRPRPHPASHRPRGSPRSRTAARSSWRLTAPAAGSADARSWRSTPSTAAR